MTTKSYRLKDQESGFHDPETHLDVARDQVVDIDTSKGAGRATLRAIARGGLIEVSSKSKSKSKEAAQSNSDLPEDFPSREHLIDGGFTSLDQVKAASDEDLQALKGVGEKSVENIREALK